jgi:hypothetical protein
MVTSYLQDTTVLFQVLSIALMNLALAQHCLAEQALICVGLLMLNKMQLPD